MKKYLLISSLLLYAPTAWSAPPPINSEDYQTLHPFAEWLTKISDKNGNICCDISDGRPTEAQRGRPESATVPVDPDPRDGKEHWWVRIEPKHFPGDKKNPLQPDHWTWVPTDKVVKNENPTGIAILWLYNGLVQCFIPGNEG